VAYYDIALLTQDLDFSMRVSGCYSSETLLGGEQPNGWTNAHIWLIASAPGFGDAYAYAIASGVSDPGRDPAVITDGQLLSAVQAVINAEAAEG
jgi:hypothetical protein